MIAVYEATYPVPTLGVAKGDRVVVRPAHPTAPMTVAKADGTAVSLDRHVLLRFMGEGHMERMVLVDLEAGVEAPATT